MAEIPGAEQWREIDAALRGDRMLDAIRLFRVATGSSLAQAKEALALRLGAPPPGVVTAVPAPAPPPEIITRYLASGHARRGELASWWRSSSGDCCVLVLYQRVPEPRFELGVFPEHIGNWSYDLNGRTYALDEVERALSGKQPLYAADFGHDHAAIAALRALIATLPIDAASAPVEDLRLRPSRTALYSVERDHFEREFLYLRRPDSARACDGVPGAGTGAVVWARCLTQCDAQMLQINERDTVFADLAAVSIDFAALAPELVSALALFLGCVDVASLRLSRLPWWLQDFAAQSTCSVGLLAPHELRHVVAHHQPLQSALLAQRGLGDMRAELASLFDAIVRAAATDRWLVGFESGT